MPDYNLERLGSLEFERLCQSLLKAVLRAPGTITFGDGPDGAREATFDGELQYPSSHECWRGRWIFQAKFHDIARVGAEKARARVIAELDSELNKICNIYKHHCDNYILLTNVRLSSTYRTGTHDKVAEIAARYPAVKHVHVWAGDELCRQLELNPVVRQSYLHFLTPGDLIAELMAQRTAARSRLAETLQLFLSDSLEKDQFAQLDQAGETDPDRTTLLRKVFVDLELRPQRSFLWSTKHRQYLSGDASRTEIPGKGGRARGGQAGIHETERVPVLNEQHTLSAVKSLISEDFRRVVLIGGPGYGKSTLGQYVAQIHRAWLLGRLGDFNGDLPPEFTPVMPRVPLRIVLKYLAQWLSESRDVDSLEAYIAELFRRSSSRHVTPEDIQEVCRRDPCLLILDGLDEVIDTRLRHRTLERIHEFLSRMEHFGSDIQVIATSRPQGYSKEFEVDRLLHFDLLPLSDVHAKSYAKRWVATKAISDEERQRVLATFDGCAQAEHSRQLLSTPLQVTIVLLIIKDRGQPPSQREALFNKYWETILSREKAKAKDVIRSEESLLFNLHCHFGYLLHKRAAARRSVESLIGKEEFLKEVRRFLRNVDRHTSDDMLAQRADELVKEASRRLVLLVEPLPGFFGFELRSFQEFFAAAYLSQTAANTVQRFARLKAIVPSSHWRNVALFFIGRVIRNNVGEAGHILELVCRPLDRAGQGARLRPGAWFALDVAEDRALALNRDLHYNALEFALTVLDVPVSREQGVRLHTVLSHLPSGDREDMARPILEAKIRSLPLPQLREALLLYAAVGGRFDTSTRGALRRCFRSARREDRRFAATAAVWLEAEPDWLVRELSRQRVIRTELFRRLPTQTYSDSYVAQLMDTVAPTTAEVEGLVERTVVHQWPVGRATVSYVDVSSAGGQVATALAVHRALEALGRGIYYRDVRAPIWRLDSGQMAVIDEALHSNVGLLPMTHAMLWLARLTSDVSAGLFEEFLGSVERIQVPAAMWREYLYRYWPLLACAAVFAANKSPVPVTLRESMSPDVQMDVWGEIKQTLARERRRLSHQERRIIRNALVFDDRRRLEVLLPRTAERADSLGITVNDVLADETYHAGRRRTEAELEYCLDVLEARWPEGPKGLKGLGSLALGRWPDATAISKRMWPVLVKTIELRADEASSYSEEILSVFVRLVLSGADVWKHAEMLLRWLGKVGHGAVQLAVYPIDPGEMRLLEPIVRLMDSRDPEIRRGAAVVGAALAADVTHRMWRRRRGGRWWPILDVRTVLRFGEKDRLVRWAVALLVLADAQVDNAKIRRRLLALLRHYDWDASYDLWWWRVPLFFELAPSRRNNAEGWTKFLEAIVDNPGHYGADVVTGAAGRLLELTKSANAELRLSGELGLT